MSIGQQILTAFREENEVLDPRGPAMAIITAPTKEFLAYLKEKGCLDETDPQIRELEKRIGEMLGSIGQVLHESVTVLRSNGLLP